MTPSNADQALAAFVDMRSELAAWTAEDLNEADTRAKIIDRLFRDVLGWSEQNIRREVRSEDGEYLDYTFESSRNKFIVEAKRQGVYFDLPINTLRLSRSGILSKSPSLSSAIHQVTRYCQAQSTAVGVVSNGLQIAVTLAYRPAGVLYDTITFGGPEEIENRFLLFWNLLSPAGNAQGRLEEILGKSEFIRQAPEFSQRLLNLLHLPDDVMNRNPVDQVLAPVIRTYFTDLTTSPQRDLLRQAYVESGRHAQYGRQLNALLADRNPRLGHLLRRRSEVPDK